MIFTVHLRWLLAYGLWVFAVSAWAQEASTDTTTVIQEILVDGLKRVDKEVVLGNLDSKIGMPLDPHKVTRDIRSIYDTQLFKDVSAKQILGFHNKAILLFEVQEKSSVKEYVIQGNDDVSKDDIKNVIDIKVGTMLNLEQLARNASKIRELYIDKGFFLADCQYRVVALANNEVEVRFVIQENQKVQVRKITFLNNHHVTDDDLKTNMSIREGNFFSFLTDAGNYKEDMFQADLYRLTGVYFDRGYINARVLKPQVQLSSDRRFIYITIPIEEGARYKVGQIKLSGQVEVTNETGQKVITQAQAEKRISTRPKQYFNRTQLMQDIEQISTLYKDQGYAYVNITPNNRLNTQDLSVDLDFDVELGDKVYIDKIEIFGNNKTRDKVIRREMQIAEGELYRGSAIELSKIRIQRLGYFETVNLTTERSQRSNHMNISITVKERSTGTFQVGGGFASQQGFMIQAQIAQQNFLGRGHNMQLNAQMSFGRFGQTIFNFRFVEPYFLDSLWSLDASIYWTQQTFNDFIRYRRGGSIGAGYPLNKSGTLSLGINYTLEHLSILDLNQRPISIASSQRPYSNFNQSGLMSSIRADFMHDSRNDRMIPTNGHYNTVSVEISDKYIGSSFNFIELSANSRSYYSPGAGIILKGQISLGYIFSRDQKGVPVAKRYFLGGISSIRGHTPFTISPMLNIPNIGNDPSSPTSSFPTGGDKSIFTNLEFEFPIVEKAGLRGVAFFDFGNVFGEFQNIFYINNKGKDVPDVYLMGSNKPIKAPLGLLYSFGLGLRWFSPIGILRFEWGIPITKTSPYARDMVFDFMIGNSF